MHAYQHTDTAHIQHICECFHLRHQLQITTYDSHGGSKDCYEPLWSALNHNICLDGLPQWETFFTFFALELIRYLHVFEQ